MPDSAASEARQAAAHTEVRLDTLEKFAVSTDNRLVNVEKTLSGVTAKLDTIVTAVTTVTSRPVWDLGKFLDIAVKAGGLCVLIAGLITYISSNINSITITENKFRTEIVKLQNEFLQTRMDNGWFQPSKMQIRAPNGQVAPQ